MQFLCEHALVDKAASTTFAPKANAIEKVLSQSDYKNSFRGKIEGDEFRNNLKKTDLLNDFEKALKELGDTIEKDAF